MLIPTIKANPVLYYLEFDEDLVILNNYYTNFEVIKNVFEFKKKISHITSIINSNIDNIVISISFNDRTYEETNDRIDLNLMIEIIYFDKIILKVKNNIPISKNRSTRKLKVFDYNFSKVYDIISFFDFQLCLDTMIMTRIDILKNKFNLNDFIKFKEKFNSRVFKKNISCYEFENENYMVSISNYLCSISYSNFIRSKIPESFLNLYSSVLNTDNDLIMSGNGFYEIRKINGKKNKTIRISNPIFNSYTNVSSSENLKKLICIKYFYYELKLFNRLDHFISDCEKTLINGNN